jgi:SAM-dependent methyltransferase
MFASLSQSIIEMERDWLKPFRRRLRPHSRVRYGDIDVYYKRFLDGGGTGFGQDFLRLFRSRRMPTQARVFEWCAGPGFIGFSLLAHGFCETLCLADVNPPAVRAARMTVRRNRLADRVVVYHSDNLADIPPTESWNVIVSNPPHFDEAVFKHHITHYDRDWHLHRDFFRDVPRFLAPDGVIVLQENNQGATAETFRPMAEAAGLRMVLVENCRGVLTPQPNYFYVGFMRAGDAAPAWVGAC